MLHTFHVSKFVFLVIAVNREEGLPCVDNLGTTRMDRATWKVDKCEFCRCLKGEVLCVSPNCTAPLEGRDCTIKPGTQDDCCPSYDCHDEGEQLLSVFKSTSNLLWISV